MTTGKYDFSGWATRNDLRCSDGRTIRHNAFVENDGQVVPLVWQHQHKDPDNVLGHAMLENRDEGVYAYGVFNSTPKGQHAKELVQHGDIRSMSIYANQLKQKGGDVLHGIIREVSLVLSPANPGAMIDFPILEHSGEEVEDEAVIYTGEEIELYHSDGGKVEEDEEKDMAKEETKKEETKEESKKSLKDIYETLNEEQKDMVNALVGMMISKDSEEDEEDVKHSEEEESDEVEHSDEDETMEAIYETLTDEQKELVHSLVEIAESGEGPVLSHDAEESMEEVYNSMTDKQQDLVNALVGMALEGENEDSDEEMEHSDDTDNMEDETMMHNVFENDAMNEGDVLTHSDIQSIFEDAKKTGSLKEAVKDKLSELGYDDDVVIHSLDTTGMTGPSSSTASQTYGFRDPDMLFPEYKSLSATPEFISRNMDWVNVVMAGVHRSPFSRIKSQFADITEDEARAKGYIKGNLKKDEVFTILKRTTDPQTIYKKQKMDRDDIIDITDFDVVAWIRGEMRVMLNEEIARATLIGDGRSASSDDKIQESHVRSIMNDVPLFNVKVPVTKSVQGGDAGLAETAKNTINAVIRGRKEYKGSGNPVFFTTEDALTEMLLIEDGIGHKLYNTEAELATALRVSKIVTVEPMTGYTVPVEVTEGGSTVTKQMPLIGIIVNLADYNVGADKGGQINMFDDFDIDYNQYKYLIETRISGALIKPFSALTVYLNDIAG